MLKHEEIERYRIAFEDLVKDARLMQSDAALPQFSDEVARVQTFLETEPPRGKGLAIFTCEPQILWRAEFLAVRAPNHLVFAPKPEYPELARQANMEGTVILNVLVNREGRVQEVILVRSSPVFDEAAEQAIRQWRFRPAIMGHEPVAAWVMVPIKFVINGE